MFFTEVSAVSLAGFLSLSSRKSISLEARMSQSMAPLLSTMFPYKRILHFWAKASLFANPTMKYILTSAGNIAVDRKAKDRRKLFRGTLEALACGGVVAVFPEGTSYTEPRIVQVKDGAAWATLEYAKWAKGHPDQVKPGAGRVAVVTASIVYTNKTKYRSNAIME
ncbi:hypothetical protein AcV7_003879 [Taiwanofungus camphoratus]|nr:hypothetical protein AcV7_003879 [Antrodia cinnamomea]